MCKILQQTNGQLWPKVQLFGYKTALSWSNLAGHIGMP